MKVYRYVTDLHEEYSARSSAIRTRLTEFAMVPPAEYFYELVYCLLTPQSSAAHAERAVHELQAAGFERREFDPSAILRHKKSYIRFHNTKARHLCRAKEQFPEITARITLSPRSAGDAESQVLREWLARNVRGLGWKESSHFLRNIGYRHLAILDRHILRNLRRHGVLRSIPTTLTQKRYLAIEKHFSSFAASVGIDMDEMDLLFWSRETGEIRK
jgi:N-glycosylase/DNA lyase